MSQTIKQGEVQVITLPTRGRAAEPIPDEEVAPLIESLSKAEDGQGVTNGRFFPRKHQAQTYGQKLREAIELRDAQYRDHLGLSVVPVDPDKKAEGPFVVAVRRK